MSTHHTTQQPGVTGDDTGKDWANTADTVRHTKEDAITERQFEELVQATYRMDDDYFALESRFVLFAAGRLGMRAGEIGGAARRRAAATPPLTPT